MKDPKMFRQVLDRTPGPCRTPGTMFHFGCEGNAVSYEIVMPVDKVITEEVAKQLEDALHNAAEAILQQLWEPPQQDSHERTTLSWMRAKLMSIGGRL